MKKKKEGAGGRLNRSEIVQARLSPKIKFAAEIIAMYERRTLSSLINSSMEVYAKACRLNLEIEGIIRLISLDDLLDKIWDTDETLRFVKTAFTNVELLGIEGCGLWDFITSTPYFWAHYELIYMDKKRKVLSKHWEPYIHIDGLIVENLKSYWEIIKTKDGRQRAVIPNEIGKKIAVPSGEEGEIIDDYHSSLPLTNRDIQKVKYEIWRENIHRLIEHEFEKIENENGDELHLIPKYPTPEEQMEMVERIYQAKNKCRSNSQ